MRGPHEALTYPAEMLPEVEKYYYGPEKEYEESGLPYGAEGGIMHKAPSQESMGQLEEGYRSGRLKSPAAIKTGEGYEFYNVPEEKAPEAPQQRGIDKQKIMGMYYERFGNPDDYDVEAELAKAMVDEDKKLRKSYEIPEGVDLKRVHPQIRAAYNKARTQRELETYDRKKDEQARMVKHRDSVVKQIDNAIKEQQERAKEERTKREKLATEERAETRKLAAEGRTEERKIRAEQRAKEGEGDDLKRPQMLDDWRADYKMLQNQLKTDYGDFNPMTGLWIPNRKTYAEYKKKQQELQREYELGMRDIFSGKIPKRMGGVLVSKEAKNDYVGNLIGKLTEGY